MGFFEFPHTRTYDSDLGWLIHTIKLLIDKMDNFSVDIKEYVQEWLDEHPEATTTVEDGSLTWEKFSDLLKNSNILVFDTTEEMTAADMTNIGLCFVKGRRTAGDGGAAFYIKTEDAADGYKILECAAGNMELLPVSGKYNAVALGFDPTGTEDNKTVMETVTANGEISISFPVGLYRFSPTKISKGNVVLCSASGTHFYEGESGGGTLYSEKLAAPENSVVFAPMDTQTYILEFDYVYNCSIQGITFTSLGIRSQYTRSYADYEAITCALYFNAYLMGSIKECLFYGVRGSAIRFNNSWEITLYNINTRFITPEGDPRKRGVFEFIDTNVHVNSSALNFCNINIESFDCNAFYGENARVENCSVSGMLVENNQILNWNDTFTNYNGNTPEYGVAQSLAVFCSSGCRVFSFNVESINYNNFNLITMTRDGVEYAYNSIAMTLDDSAIAITLGTLSADTVADHTRWYTGTTETFGRIKKFIANAYSNNTGSNRLYGIVGTLTECKLPDESFIYPANPSTLFHPIKYDLMQTFIPIQSATYQGTPVFFRRYAPDRRVRYHVAMITPDWAGVGITPSENQNIILSVQACTQDPNFILIAAPGSEITVQQLNSDGTVQVTATKTVLSNQFDVYRMTVDIGQLYARIEVRANAASMIYFMK